MLKKDSVEIRPENICPDTCLTLALVHKEKPWEPEVAVVYMYRSKIAYAAMKSGDDAGYFAFRAKKSSGLLMVNKETEQNRISGKKNLKIMIADYVHNNPLAYACLETAIIEHAAKYGVEPQLVRGFHGTSPNIILSGDGKIASVYCDARYKWKINDSERKTLEKSQDPTLIAWSRSANAVLLWSNWIAAGTIIRGFGYQVTDIDGNLHNENTAYIFDPTDINANPETTLLIRPAAGFYPLVNNDYDIMPAINSGIQDADIIIRAYKNGINPMRQILNQIEVQTAGK
jgi:hypothetical protein